MYITRHLEERIAHLGDRFRIVLVLGARQVGKTTLLKHLWPESKYFVFDPVQDLYNVRQDADLFLKSYLPPLILDEVQYAPELIASLKRQVDLVQKNGQYYLTGSQNFTAIRQVSESLAGRVAIVELDPMSIYELSQVSSRKSWINTYLQDATKLISEPYKLLDLDLLSSIWQGGFPGTIGFDGQDYSDFFRSYLQTYVERDVRVLANVRDLNQFSRFVSLQSALTAQEVNASHLGREIGISAHTAQEWTHVLENSYQWLTIPAYSGNLLKRLSNKPKGYFSDTGFACHLARINSKDGLLGHPLFGHLFETFCVNQIIRTLKTFGKSFSVYHWRTSGGAEVDLILELDGTLFPIEFKAKSNPSRRDSSGINQFMSDYSHLNVAEGVVVHGGDRIYKLAENITAVPWSAYFDY